MLIDYSTLFSVYSNVIVSIFRTILWFFIRCLLWLCDGLEKAMMEVFSKIDFFSSDAIGINNNKTGLYGTFLKLFWALLTLGVVVLGIMLMTGRIKEKSRVPTNLLFCVLFAMAMPAVLSTFSRITSTAITTLSPETSFASQLVINNVTDLQYLDKNNFSQSALEQKNNFGATDIAPQRFIDENETIYYKDAENKELFQSDLDITSDGTVTIKKVASRNTFGIGWLDKLRYRYQINWLILFVSSLAMAIAMISVIAKTLKSVYEIGYDGIFFLLVAPLDLATGQRAKKIAEEIMNLFAVLILTMLNFVFYIEALKFTTSFSLLPQLIAQCVFAGLLFSGPSIIRKVLGMEGGAGSLQGLASGLYTAKTLGGAVSGGIKGAGNLAAGLGSAAGKAGIAGAAGAGYMQAGIKNAMEHARNGKKGNGQTPADYHILPSDGATQSGKSLSDGGSQNLLGDGLDTNGGGNEPTSPPLDNEPLQTDSAQTGASSINDLNAPTTQGSAEQNAKNPPLDTKSVNRADTIPSALSKLTASTKAGKGAKKYTDTIKTAYSVGQNSANKAWENARNAPKPIPHANAEIVNPPKPNPTQRTTPKNVDITGHNNKKDIDK